MRINGMSQVSFLKTSCYFTLSVGITLLLFLYSYYCSLSLKIYFLLPLKSKIVDADILITC